MQSLMEVKYTFNVVTTLEFSICSKNQSLVFYSVQISTNYQQIIPFSFAFNATYSIFARRKGNNSSKNL